MNLTLSWYLVLPEDVKPPDGLEVAVTILTDETSEEAWAALSAGRWEQDWVEEYADLVKEE